ncbi:MAG: hypothetical protein ACRYGR_07245 [Janthinobacterium lividum]
MNKLYFGVVLLLCLEGCISNTNSDTTNGQKVHFPFQVTPASGPREDRSFSKDTVSYYNEAKIQAKSPFNRSYFNRASK